jgi:hypothetical protein
MEKLGLYTSGREDSYREVEPVGTKAKISFDMPRGRQAEDWFEVVAKRQSERDETEDNYNYAKIEFESDKPVVIGFTGDWHLGSRIDHDMLMRDVLRIQRNTNGFWKMQRNLVLKNHILKITSLDLCMNLGIGGMFLAVDKSSLLKYN